MPCGSSMGALWETIRQGFDLSFHCTLDAPIWYDMDIPPDAGLHVYAAVASTASPKGSKYPSIEYLGLLYQESWPWFRTFASYLDTWAQTLTREACTDFALRQDIHPEGPGIVAWDDLGWLSFFFRLWGWGTVIFQLSGIYCSME